MLASALVGLIV